MDGDCSACQVVMINGVRCHEIGCPEAWRDYEIECCDCGCDFKRTSPRQIRCNECTEAFHDEYHGVKA